MSHKKTLIILTPGFPKDENDSTCLPMQQQLVETFQKLDSNLNIIVLSFQYPYHGREYYWRGIRVIPFNGQNKGGITRLMLRKTIMRVLVNIHREHTITSLISFWYGECAAVGHLFAKRNRLTHFCWILGQDAKKENKYPKRAGLKANELIAISDSISARFEMNQGPKPQHIIPPGLDTSLFGATPGEKTIELLGVGSLIPLKRFDIFIEIVTAIKKQSPGIKAELIGNGPEKENLSAMIEELDLHDTLSFVGELPYPKVLSRMQKAKLLLHPSAYEGFSGVCMEALFAGAHVISFCKPMNADIQQWHIASSVEQMTQQAIHILNTSPFVSKNNLYRSIEETATEMLALILQQR